MKRPKQPCYGCRERSGECHRDCSRYNTWLEEIREWRELIFKNKYPLVEIYIKEKRKR